MDCTKAHEQAYGQEPKKNRKGEIDDDKNATFR